ncbi:MAG: Hsp20/alpha crystallin family protein [Halanaerobiales bacterium]|nr:Hsp20/alpha crystallin family protein [Halanaerobiales bacterium]
MFDLIPSRRSENKMTERSEDPFDALWNSFFNNVREHSELGFRTDVKETEDKYIIDAELPGMNKDNIKVEMEDNYLTITANNENYEEEESEGYIRRERRKGSYCRSFYIENIKEDEVEAEYNNGILEISLPKKEETVTRKKKIDIK